VDTGLMRVLRNATLQQTAPRDSGDKPIALQQTQSGPLRRYHPPAAANHQSEETSDEGPSLSALGIS